MPTIDLSIVRWGNHRRSSGLFRGAGSLAHAKMPPSKDGPGSGRVPCIFGVSQWTTDLRLLPIVIESWAWA